MTSYKSCVLDIIKVVDKYDMEIKKINEARDAKRMTQEKTELNQIKSKLYYKVFSRIDSIVYRVLYYLGSRERFYRRTKKF